VGEAGRPGKLQPLREKSQSLAREKSQSPLREKSQSLARERRATQRKRMATQWEASRERANGSDLTNHERSPESEKYAQEQPMIEMSKEKMDRFVRNLHKLEWAYDFLRQKTHPARSLEETRQFKEHMRAFKYDQDCPINEAAINYMICRRYELLNYHLEDIYETNSKKLDEQATSIKRTRLADPHDYRLLHSLSSNSILALIHRHSATHRGQRGGEGGEGGEGEGGEGGGEGDEGEGGRQGAGGGQGSFSLPFAEFISFRETKASIYRLTRMNMKTCYKIAFGIFDKNRNGKIDQNDLLQLISLSRKLTLLEPDIIVIANAMLAQQRPRPPRKLRVRTERDEAEPSSAASVRSRQRTMSKESEAGAVFSPIKEESSESENENTENPLSSSRFSLEKLYTFLKEKEQGQRGGRSLEERRMEPLSFTAFCLAFRTKRPAVIYDLLQFVFGAAKQDLADSVQSELSEPPRANVSAARKPEEETLEEKWNKRLKQTNAILAALVSGSKSEA
jgi:hypothetical protein